MVGTPRGNIPTRDAYSAGGVIYRQRENSIDVALIATGAGTRWGLPKGHIATDEQPQQAAQREIEEETGLRGEILYRLDTIEYWFRVGRTRIHKVVDLYLLRYQSGEVVPQVSEVDDARWVAIDEAIMMATFPRERAVLEQVRDLWLRGDLP